MVVSGTSTHPSVAGSPSARHPRRILSHCSRNLASSKRIRAEVSDTSLLFIGLANNNGNLRASRASDLGVGESFSVLLVGSPHGYAPNYGATLPGGVHNDLLVRDIHLYSQKCQYTPIRGAAFYPISVGMGATTSGPNVADAATNIPTNLLIERTGVGVYVIYVGAFNKATGAFTADDNTAVGITATDPAAGTITITAAAELASDVLSGWLSVSYQQED